MANEIPIDSETKVVAMLSRGDKQVDIAKEMGISEQTVSAIKKRNTENIAMIHSKMLEREQSEAIQIKTRAQRLANKKLRWAEEDADKVRTLTEQVRAGELDKDDFKAQAFNTEEVTLKDLASLIKDVDTGQPDKRQPDSTDTASLKALVKALESGDEVALERIVFNPKDDIIEHQG